MTEGYANAFHLFFIPISVTISVMDKKLTTLLAIVFLCVLVAVMACGCANDNADNIIDDGVASQTGEDAGSADNSSNSDGLTILCASFSEYDWTRNIIGDNPAGIDLELLNTSGVDIHSYQPSVSDMVRIADADLLIYTGGISEFWIDKATESSEKSLPSVLSLMDYFLDNPSLFPTYEQEEHDHDHGHEHEHAEDDANEHSHNDGDEHEHEADEHIWLSLKMAPVFCSRIEEALAELDPENADLYKENLKSYCDELSELDSAYESTVANARTNVLLFADRFPFLYMTQDYGLGTHAAFYGCSAETEASFETIIDLAEDLNTDGLTHIVILKGSTEDLAQTIIKAADQKLKGSLSGITSSAGHMDNSGAWNSDRKIDIETLDSLQSVTSDDIAGGLTYIDAMKKNLEVLTECLS